MFHNESFLKRFFRKMESRNYINGYLENVAQCVIKKKRGSYVYDVICKRIWMVQPSPLR